MIRFLKAILFIPLAACATLPNVVTVVKPYVPIIAIDNPDAVTWLGMMRCDIAGHPFILINPRQTPDMFASTVIHERVHVADVERFGSCRGFVERYAADSMFRLKAEATAFCQVYRAQLASEVEPMPPSKQLSGCCTTATNRTTPPKRLRKRSYGVASVGVLRASVRARCATHLSWRCCRRLVEQPEQTSLRLGVLVTDRGATGSGGTSLPQSGFA